MHIHTEKSELRAGICAQLLSYSVSSLILEGTEQGNPQCHRVPFLLYLTLLLQFCLYVSNFPLVTVPCHFLPSPPCFSQHYSENGLGSSTGQGAGETRRKTFPLREGGNQVEAVGLVVPKLHVLRCEAAAQHSSELS